MERTILKAKDGYIFTNGETYGETIYLAEGEDGKDFYEITKEEYKKKVEDEQTENIEEGETEINE